MGLYLLAIGSIDFPVSIEKKHLGEGIYEERVNFLEDYTEVYTGKFDAEGRYQGPYTIKTTDYYGHWIEEQVVMVNGKRHGKCDVKRSNGASYSTCYNMGVKVDCLEKSAEETDLATSAYELLKDRYPWFVYKMNAFGFDDVYIKSYLDTAELLLYQTAVDEEYFNDYFNMIVSDLEETPYDSIIVLNGAISHYLGIQEMKHSELRLAVINRYRSAANSTHNIVNSTFPYYLAAINEKGVDDTDFEIFCDVLDSCMDTRGILNLEDPFFIDSIDLWLSESLEDIYESEEYTTEEIQLFQNNIRPTGRNDFESDPPEVANVVSSFIIQRYKQGDMLKRAAREAYILNKGLVRLPVLSTVFSKNSSATSANLTGYILDEGGAEVTASGIAWAIHYNPTTDDHSLPSQTGTDKFTLTVDELTEGSTYYARTYATNSAGTAYGNCISFVATAPTGTDETENINHSFSIYPNPASILTTFRFHLNKTESIRLTIIDINGRVVLEHDPGILFPGENQFQLDLSDLPNGLYTCLLIKNEITSGTQNLILVH